MRSPSAITILEPENASRRSGFPRIMSASLKAASGSQSGAMRVRPSSSVQGWALIACAALAGCGASPPPPAAGPREYQPGTLAEAVVVANTTAVENFLALGVDPNEPEPDGTTPLMRAVYGQMRDTAQLLIDAGADARKANSYGVTPLYIAARAGDNVATRMLLAAGADANAALPASGETVLMTASKAGNADAVRALLTGGDDSVSLAALGDARAAARVAESAGYSVPANPTLNTNYADVNARERLYGRTALMIAAIEGDLDVVRLLVEAGSDLNIVDVEGSTALTLARSYGNLDVAALLEEAGAN
jgi:ankyrin repeat protein